MRQFRICAPGAALISVVLLAAPAAHAGYAKVNQSDWQQGVTGLPTYVNMYSYMPSTLASKPPIVVYTHHCQGSASSSHSSMGPLETIADKNGFIIIYPEATGENCWDAGSKRSLNHGGGGDTGAIVQMIKYVISKYNGDPARVYVAGDSSGGIMTEALLGVYPDVFMAGVSIMGVPCGCWADGYNDTTGSGSTAQWSGNCANGSVTKTGQQWGDLVRSYFPGYTGHRPRVQQWHGSSDTTLNYKNVAEDIKEWTNLLGLSETPTGTEQNTPKSGTTHQYWKNSCFTVYETFVLSGVGHAVSVDGGTLAKYFGIDTAGGQDPETAACGASAVPGGSGGGGAGGGGGSTGGPGGATGTTGSGGSSGTKDGGATGKDGSAAREAGSPGAGGVEGTGGGGLGGSTGTAGKGGTSGGSGGSPGSGGSTAKGTGGTVGTGGASVTSGSGGAGSGGAQAGGGASGQGGNSGSGPVASQSSSGFCAVASRHGSAAPTAALLLVAFVLLLRRRQRTGR